jgi:hypothetical protein
MFSSTSADAALLDVFSLTDEAKVSNMQLSSVVAGQVNLSNAPVPVLQALLSGGSKKDIDAGYNISNASALAQKIALQLNPSNNPSPLGSRADLVTRLSGAIQSAMSGTGDTANKAYLEAPVRALSDISNTRTWNLLVDIIAQAGYLTNNATSLDSFAVEAERRYWLHLAIDRYSGKILMQQLEPVYE